MVVCRLDRRMRAKAAAPAAWMVGGTFLFAAGAISLLLVPRIIDAMAGFMGTGVASYVAYAQAALATTFGISLLLGGILGWRQHDAVGTPPSSADALRGAGKVLMAVAAAVLLPGVALSLNAATVVDYWQLGGPLAVALLLNVWLLYRWAGPREPPPAPSQPMF